MQTFLPYSDFWKSARCLDYRRLGNQRTEARMIIQLCYGVIDNNYRNHPAVRMWKGYEGALKKYYNTIMIEWIRRGYHNTMHMALIDDIIQYPPWLGCEEFHAAHRSNLLRKDYEYYKKYGWEESTDLPYIWPVSK